MSQQRPPASLAISGSSTDSDDDADEDDDDVDYSDGSSDNHYKNFCSYCCFCCCYYAFAINLSFCRLYSLARITSMAS